MAIYNNSSWSRNPISVVTITVSLFLMLAHNVMSTSFQFPPASFGNTNGIIAFQGDAFASNGTLHLTKVVNGAPLPYSAGRASYAQPVRLWDAKTGELAGFTTTFSFVVAPAPYVPGPFADGIAFFIAPFPSNMPNDSSGGFLGLFSADTALNAYKNQIVAVEFDSFSNPWDPSTAHIGIDVNSIASVTTTPWQAGNAGNAFLATATVNYEPGTNNLSVSVRHPGSHVNGTSSSLSFVIDLRTVLPEWVRVGFSGATGRLVETHWIVDWTFTSSF